MRAIVAKLLGVFRHECVPEPFSYEDSEGRFAPCSKCGLPVRVLTPDVKTKEELAAAARAAEESHPLYVKGKKQRYSDRSVAAKIRGQTNVTPMKRRKEG